MKKIALLLGIALLLLPFSSEAFDLSIESDCLYSMKSALINEGFVTESPEVSMVVVADCVTYKFTNNTGSTASDAHVTFTGTGGDLFVQVITNPPGCPAPGIPSNGQVTNTMVLDWGGDCLQPGESVTVKVTTNNGPLDVNDGWWSSVVNQTPPGIGLLDVATDVEIVDQQSAGCTDNLACNFNPEVTEDDGSCCYQSCLFVQAFSSDPAGWLGGQLQIIDLVTGLTVESYSLQQQEEFVTMCLPDGCYLGQLTAGVDADILDVFITFEDQVVFDELPGNGIETPEFLLPVGPGPCVPGCLDPAACNFDPTASFDDGSCILPFAEDAIAMAIPHLDGQPNAGELTAYVLPDQLPPGSLIQSADVDGISITLDEYSFLIWVDLEPWAKFSHPTQFLVVNPCSGELLVIEDQWWPVVDGVELWDTNAERALGEGLFYGTPPPEPAAPTCIPDPTFQGGDGSYEKVCMYLVSGVDIAENKWADSDLKNAKKSLEAYFGAANVASTTTLNNPTQQALCDALAAAANDPDKDKFVFYFTGHAAKTYLALRAHPRGDDDRELTPAELKEKLEAFDCPVWVMIDACNAKDIANGLTGGTINGHALYSSKECTPSMGTSTGSAWTNAIVECLNNAGADGDDPGTDVSPAEAAVWAENALNSSGDSDHAGQDSGIIPLGAAAPLCYFYTMTNNTGNPASDLHATFSGTGGSITTAVLINPPACPPPAIPSNGPVTNTMVLDWGINCVAPGASVTVKITIPAPGPLEFISGFWTGVGQQVEPGVGPLAPEDVVPVEPVEGCPNPLACNYDPTVIIDDGSCFFPTEQLAIDLVLPHIETLPQQDVAVGYIQQLAPGDIIQSLSPEDPFVFTAEQDEWLVWMDLEPLAQFEHTCQLILVDPCGGQMDILDAHSSPVLNGQPIWDSNLDRYLSPDVFFGTPPVEPLESTEIPDSPTSGGDDSYSNVCIYLVSGVDTATNKWAGANLRNIDKALCTYFGEENIDGKVVQNNPTMEQICDSLEAMAAHEEKDKFVFMFTGHASKTYMELRSETVFTDDFEFTPAELKVKLAEFDVPLWIMIDACNAKNIADGLADLQNDGHVMYSSDDCKPSWYLPSTGSFWPKYFAECLNDPDADGDDEGDDVSPAEASAWAEDALNNSGDPFDSDQSGQDSGMLPLAGAPEQFCYVFQITNNTGNIASDLHLEINGSGGELNVQVTGNPPDCPAPVIPSNGDGTNMVLIDWGFNCVLPGQSVTIKITSPHMPLSISSGWWSAEGNQVEPGVGTLDPEEDVDQLEPTPCPTDLTGDGITDTADLIILLAQFGCSGGCSADVTGDDQVNTSDLVVLLAKFGQPC